MKQRLNTWVYVLKRSLFDPEYYQELLKAKFSFSIKFLYGLLFFFALFWGLQFAYWIGFRALPNLPQKLNEFKSELKKAYPQELTVYLKNGEVSTNVKEPYFLNIPAFQKELENEKYNNLIVINTKAKVDDYPRYKTLILVTKNSVVHPPERSKSISDYAVTSLTDLKANTTINQVQYLKLVEKIEPLINAVPTMLTILFVLSITLFPWIIALFWLGGKMYYLLILSAFAWIIARIMKKSLTYKQMYRLGMHAVVLPSLLVFLMSLFNYQVGGLYTLIFIFWTIAIMRKLK